MYYKEFCRRGAFWILFQLDLVSQFAEFKEPNLCSEDFTNSSLTLVQMWGEFSLRDHHQFLSET